MLLVVLVAIQFVLICIWSWRRHRLAARLVWVGFASMPLLGMLNVFVVTPREQVVQTCHDLADMLEGGDVVAIGRHLADDLVVEGRTKEQLLDRLGDVLTRRRVENLRLTGFSVEFSRPNVAEAVFDATCSVRPSGAIYDRLMSRWRITFRRNGDSWRVCRVETLPAPFSPVRALRDLL